MHSFCQSIETRGAPPSGLEGGSWVSESSFPNPGQCHAQWIKALLRPRQPALHHLQLLPAAPFSGKQRRAEPLCARTRASPQGIRFLALGLRGHAGACPSAARRAAEGHAFNGVADVEAASVAQNAEEEAKPATGTASPEFSRATRESAQLLASAVLRFQRKHQTENKRETRVHAWQPDKPRISRASQELVVEQLGVLRKNGVSASFYRRSSGMKDKDERSRKPKTHPLTPRVEHPRKRIASGFIVRATRPRSAASINVSQVFVRIRCY